MRTFLILIGLALLVGAVAVVAGVIPREALPALPGLTDPPLEVRDGGPIVATTDRLEYAFGTDIFVELKNSSDAPILSHLGTMTPLYALEYVEKLEADGTWSLARAHCEYPHCTYKVHSPSEILPGRSERLRWKPMLYPEGKLETQVLGPGVYRLVIKFQEREGEGHPWEWVRVRTPELRVNGEP